MKVSSKYLQVFKNALSLYSIQGFQHIAALISLPWLVRALGTDGYGWINIAGAFGGYIQILCEYGFQWNVSREIALCRNDKARVSKLISATIVAKFLLAIASLTVASVVIYLIPSYRAHFGILLFGIIGAVATAFHPSWIFQGMEQMGKMAALSSIVRGIQLALTLLFIHQHQDLYLALLINSFAAVLNTIVAWVLAKKEFNIGFIMPTYEEVCGTLRGGLEIFVSQAGSLLFNNTNIMILGFFSTPHAVGLYAIAEKITRIIVQASAPIGSAMFPRVAILLETSREQAFSFLRKMLSYGSIFFVILILGLIAGADIIVRFICGGPNQEVIPLIYILSPIPLTIYINSIFGIQILLNSGYKTLFMIVPLAAGVISIVLQLSLIPRIGVNGAALSLLISELTIFTLYLYLTWKKTGFPFHPKVSVVPEQPN